MNAEIIADSLNTATGDRLTTFVLPRFPKILAQELLTHRAFSRNSASSRAIPISRVIERIQQDPYIPTFTRNRKGMVGIEDLAADTIADANSTWESAMNSAIAYVRHLDKLSIHKQEANRILEPFMRIPVIVTATDWNNFFRLRTADDTQPDFRAVAVEMFELYQAGKPKSLNIGEWHIPYISYDSPVLGERLKISSARCARVSYATHDGKIDLPADIKLHDRLLQEAHMSPLEHQAKAIPLPIKCRNFQGWMSYRQQLEEGLLN